MQGQAKRWKAEGLRIGLVPTMGSLHAGHLSLIKNARRLVGHTGKVVVSIYVNPSQFGPREDFSAYPRDLRRDMARCRQAGADAVFAPVDAQMYPSNGQGCFSTWIVEEDLSKVMEGKARPGHFRGVATVVAKLFNLVQPDVAVFGAKDFQQAAIVQRMTRDLNFPVRIEIAPTAREADGLAHSSRNRYLTDSHRSQALVLWRSIQAVRAAVSKSGKPIAASRLKDQVAALVAKEPDARLDYVEFFEPRTLQPVAKVGQGSHMALAVFIGKTRLIDNAAL